MKSFIAATLLLASLGFAAPPDSPSPKAPPSPSKPNPVKPQNKLPDEAVEALKSGVKFILFSLEPERPNRDQLKKMKAEQMHHGFKILGSTELVNAETKSIAIASITDAVQVSDGLPSLCFEPRHSLRVATSKGTTYDFVTCFKCHQLEIYSGSKLIGRARIDGSGKRLDEILTATKIPLAKPPEANK